MSETEIITAKGTWKVLKKDNEICIVDSEGRERHRSKGHVMTAVHLAMMLAEKPLEPDCNADAELRRSAKEFINEDNEENAASGDGCSESYKDV
jgi:hypothetical protein